jgi:acetyltransferase-like isoleucine patch superfamily enzyme
MHLWYALCKFPSARFEPWVRWKGRGQFIIGKGVFVCSNAVMSSAAGATLELGDGVWVGPDSELAADGHIQVGERTSLQSRTQLLGDVELGAGCVAAPNLYVSSGWHAFARTPALPIRVQDYQKGRAPEKNERSRRVRIGDDCWIGINVVVTPGVTVGRGCVIGANSVVTRDLPPYTIAGGAPARPLGKRLEFVPPRSLDAASDSDIPYFYSGFRQLGRTQEEDAAPPRVRGGWPVRKSFVLALAAAEGNVVTLLVDAAVPGELAHGDRTAAIAPGQQTLVFSARLDQAGFLAFTWKAHNGRELSGLVVIRAAVEAASTGGA